MILKLKNKTIEVQSQAVPEPIQNTRLRLIFETGTNHLIPRVYINKDMYIGVNRHVDFRQYVDHDTLDIKVDLYNSNEVVVRSYAATVPFIGYALLGDKPVRPDLEDYIRQLEERIEILEEEGEVI